MLLTCALFVHRAAPQDFGGNKHWKEKTAVCSQASHRWVESVAVAAAFVAAGSGIWAVVAFLLPFSLGPLVGIAIGVSVDNTNAWVVLVLFALVAGGCPLLIPVLMGRCIALLSGKEYRSCKLHECQDRVHHLPHALIGIAEACST
jgi:hypothetical protein